MNQNRKPTKPSQQNPEQGNEIDPIQREPIGPGGDHAGIDKPGAPTKKNPGHTNPSHNTPGHVRRDQPRQQEQGQPGQEQTQSYPGIKGPKTRELQRDSAIDRDEAEQVKDNAEKLDSDNTKTLEKSKESRNDQ